LGFKKGENMLGDPADTIVDKEKLTIEYIKSHRLVAKYRNDDESVDYINGYKDGYNNAIENLLNNIHML
jgi:hypothetical protein